ncbi:hypothetical protein [Brevibacterium linens]|uniref:Uncharacterized protein n=1 Tax=Brevibacterium linens ATCC 9172 TaxID=1255617 RepID=A0A2H1JAH9_BRELN|nr:hypothetical protein [Brevibacterium linens]KAB1948110.1 hypothetical protein F8227_07300 [Brevibacterium linens ATCC 9172]SMX84338.1 hypothetical protein BLIN9172_01931 [Brevibacterium linens ATCC 9172]
MKKLLQDRQSIRAGVLVALMFPLVYFAMHLLGWGSDSFNWWQTLLGGLFTGVFFWFFTSSFRQFRDEDVTPR